MSSSKPPTIKSMNGDWLEYAKTFMPVIAVLIGSVAGYVLVDRHAQNMSEREQELKVIEFESQNIFRILEKYLEQQPYPELARHQMLGFIAETTHNEGLKAWAVLQRKESVESAMEFLALSKEISLRALQRTKQQFEIDQKAKDKEIEYQKKKSELTNSLRARILELRSNLKAVRSTYAGAEIKVATADSKRDRADKELSEHKQVKPNFANISEVEQSIYVEKLRSLTVTRNELEAKFLKAREGYDSSRSNVRAIEQELKEVKSDLGLTSGN